MTVRLQGNGFLMNNTTFVPLEDGNAEYELIKEWLKNNEAEPEFNKEQLNIQRVSSIKTKASEIITSRYSIVWQLNHPRTDETYKAEYEWIDKIREISNKAELEGTALEDINWNLI